MCIERLSPGSVGRYDNTRRRSSSRQRDKCWLVPGLLLPAMMCTCAGIIIYGFVAISPKVHSEVCSLGYFRCGNLSTCVAQKDVCNDIVDCENGADEEILTCKDNQGHVMVFLQSFSQASEGTPIDLYRCDLPDYPIDCHCYRSTAVGCFQGTLTEVPTPLHENTTNLILIENQIQYINDTDAFSGLFSLSRLYLQYNGLAYIQPGVFNDLTQLQWLLLNGNALRIIEEGVFEPLISLIYLDLSDNFLMLKIPDIFHVPANIDHILLENNMIQQITKNTFILARNTKVLLLGHNNISHIHRDALLHVQDLVEIDLQHNRLTEIAPETFQYNYKLTKLTLDNNPLTSTSVINSLRHAQGLVSLGLKEIDLGDRPLDSITTMKNLAYINFKSHRSCRYAPMAHMCTPKEDGISSLTNLLQHKMHRICIWVITIITIFGNLFVIICRCHWQEESSIHALFITHLCTADMMTGMFLLVIAVYDIILRDEYNRHALWWVSSWACAAAGTLGVMAAEVSVLVLAFVAFERFISITFPFQPALVDNRKARIVMGAIWITSATIAILPLTSESTFGKFYSTNGVCFPLFIDAPFSSGWQYSCFILLGINMTALVCVCFFYSGLFRNLHRIRLNSATGGTKTNLARRLMAIVLVYFLCLVPIIVTKIAVLAGCDIPVKLNAWMTVFVVPVNSAFNPLIYTIFTPSFCRQFRDHIHRNRRSSAISSPFSSFDVTRRNLTLSVMVDSPDVRNTIVSPTQRLYSRDTTDVPETTTKLLLDSTNEELDNEDIIGHNNNVHKTCMVNLVKAMDNANKTHND